MSRKLQLADVLKVMQDYVKRKSKYVPFKYCETAIVFAEIPDEITLAINISNCPHRCDGCHSSYLQQNVGEYLTFDTLDKLILDHPDATCICFMGGDNDHASIIELIYYINFVYPKLKVGMYSGDDIIDYTLLKKLDYYKYGSYKKDLGGITSRTTNQILFRRTGDQIQRVNLTSPN